MSRKIAIIKTPDEYILINPNNNVIDSVYLSNLLTEVIHMMLWGDIETNQDELINKITYHFNKLGLPVSQYTIIDAINLASNILQQATALHPEVINRSFGIVDIDKNTTRLVFRDV